jgi:hypothetical protein
LSVAALGGVAKLQAQSTSTATSTSAGDSDKISQLEKDNQLLQKRLDNLENLAQKNGLLPSGGANGDPPVSAMSDFSITGFVTASYVHDSSEPPAANGHIIPGYLWDRVNDSISINKVKLTFASPPAVASGDKFDAAYRVSLIAGQDAPIVNTSSKTIGFDYLREAYLEMNVPIGTGLNIRAGELISLLNYESGDGSAANDNLSQGFQWFFTGNPPAGAIQLGYDFTDQIGIKLRVQNGLYAGPIDNNSSKTFLGRLDLKPMKNVWIDLNVFAGREDSFAQDVAGGEVLAGWQATTELHLGTELDYFNFYNPQTAVPRGHNSVFSGGLWTSYDFTKEVRLALRTEYLSDPHGADASGGAITAGSFTAGGPLGLLNPAGTGQDITSIALTLDYMPSPRIKIMPEIRYDHTSWSHGWDPSTALPAATAFGNKNRFIFGAGASYLF